MSQTQACPICHEPKVPLKVLPEVRQNVQNALTMADRLTYVVDAISFIETALSYANENENIMPVSARECASLLHVLAQYGRHGCAEFKEQGEAHA